MVMPISMNWLDDVKYCARECERQESGEMSVYNMCFALHYTRGVFYATKRRLFTPVNEATILQIGKLVEPTRVTGYRSIPVIVHGVRIQHEYIPRQMENLLSFQKDMTPVEFYKEFEEIHPFIDGNGRVGSILYNWMLGSLEMPVAPPDVFKPVVRDIPLDPPPRYDSIYYDAMRRIDES